METTETKFREVIKHFNITDIINNLDCDPPGVRFYSEGEVIARVLFQKDIYYVYNKAENFIIKNYNKKLVKELNGKWLRVKSGDYKGYRRLRIMENGDDVWVYGIKRDIDEYTHEYIKQIKDVNIEEAMHMLGLEIYEE